MQVTEGDIPPPDLWRHDHSGGLSCAYSGGTRTFTWSPADVSEMARRWRRAPASGAPAAQRFRDAHERLEAVAAAAGLGPPDVVIHDLERAEVRGHWRRAADAPRPVSGCEVDDLEARVPRNGVEVRVPVHERRAVANRDGRDQAVRQPADRGPLAPAGAVESRR